MIRARRWPRRPALWTLGVLVLWAWLTTGTGAIALDRQSPAAAARPAKVEALSVQITSPLGRTGLIGPVRIVARIVFDPETSISPVQFFVDGVLVGQDNDGAPYAVEWKDDNPFQDRTIVVQVADSSGRSARDEITLAGLTITESTSISSVVMDTLVFDARGRPVNGLRPEDFSVTEDGTPQTLDVAAPDTAPATYTLLVDSSQSMARRMEFVRDAARALPARLRANDQVMVVPFAKGLGVTTGPTRDRDTIGHALDAIAAAGGTAILDSLTSAARQLRTIDTRHIIVLITDGYDENSEGSFAESLDAVRNASATVYVIGIGGVAGISLKGEDLLRRLAQETGGRAFFPSREFQLSDVHGLIAEDVQQRYVLSYTPANQRLDGTWRAIAVTTKDPTRVVRSRAGYFAPKPPPIRPQIELTVRDTSRQLIDVSREDLEVLEDGVPQRLEGFEESTAPVAIALALDSSGSMKNDASAAVEAARSFIRTLPAKDKLAVLTFADKPVLAHELTTLREWSLDAIGKYQANGGTALYDAIADAAAQVKNFDGRRVVVVVTDGRDENNPGTAPGSVRTIDQASKAVRDAGVIVYAIGLGEKVDRDTLERIAALSGGEAYFPLEVSALADDYRRVIENIRRRYVISYTSTNDRHDGGWRAVEIRTKRTGLVIESKGGYFAPNDGGETPAASPSSVRRQ